MCVCKKGRVFGFALIVYAFHYTCMYMYSEALLTANLIVETLSLEYSLCSSLSLCVWYKCLPDPHRSG